MSDLTISEIYAVARRAGFSPQQASTWTAIALAESGGRTRALATKGEHSIGLWQINVAADSARATRYGDLHDPLANARAAYDISRHGTDLRPWTTTHDSHRGTATDYRHYLAQVEAQTGVKGNWRGVSGYDSSDPGNTDSSSDRASYDAPSGRKLTAAAVDADSDHDGLTDAFEQRTGVRSPTRDTDHDGLSDAVEAANGTSTTSVDTDGDGLNDALEASFGTNPLDADTDDDGFTDGYEQLHHTGPRAPGTSTTPTVAPWRPSAVPPDPSASSTSVADQVKSSAVSTFLQQARAQRGDSYLYGSTPKLSTKDPTQFDCSSLVQWAADKAGTEVPRTAEEQYRFLKSKGSTMSVDEALHTPGALLFYFSRYPSSALPAGQAHVAISLGDGRTIEARGRQYGVGEWSAKGRFNYAGTIPGLTDQTSVSSPTVEPTSYDIASGRSLGTASLDVDSDHDGLTDAFERRTGVTSAKPDSDHDGLSDALEASLGTDIHSVDTDGDRLNDALEVSYGTNPLALDSDHDGLTDAYERAHHLNPLVAGGVGVGGTDAEPTDPSGGGDPYDAGHAGGFGPD